MSVRVVGCCWKAKSFVGVGVGVGQELPKKISNALTALQVQNLKTPGNHADGGGLYLQISKSGARSWIYKFRFQGKLKEMGLGSLMATSLKDARAKRDKAKAILDSGRNPIVNSRLEKLKSSREVPYFGNFALEMIEVWKNDWSSEKTVIKWKRTVNHFCKDLFKIPIDLINTDHVFTALLPYWKETPETAERVRGHLKRFFDAAKVKGFRDGENPAIWTGHLEHLLPQKKQREVKHHAAVPYKDIPTFYKILREMNSMSALALEFTILTAVRTNETRMAQKSEFDFKENIWSIPAKRMKMTRDHRVPLCARAVEIVKFALDFAPAVKNPYIFRGVVKEWMSNQTMLECLRGIKGYEDFTVHGFRSSFRDWQSEETDHEDAVAEAALAHLKGDKVEKAYKRGDWLKKRKALMDDWADYCQGIKPLSKEN